MARKPATPQKPERKPPGFYADLRARLAAGDADADTAEREREEFEDLYTHEFVAKVRRSLINVYQCDSANDPKKLWAKIDVMADILDAALDVVEAAAAAYDQDDVHVVHEEGYQRRAMLRRDSRIGDALARFESTVKQTILDNKRKDEVKHEKTGKD